MGHEARNKFGTTNKIPPKKGYKGALDFGIFWLLLIQRGKNKM
jgi:hypothetical protein